jgi:ribosomal-protein-alanine N-acetyltransferase
MTVESAFTRFPVLTTERLTLRKLRISDAKTLYPLYSDTEAMKYYGHAHHQRLEDTEALLKRLEERYQAHEGIRWGVTLHGDDTVLGTCSLHHFDLGHRHVETGYDLHPAYWGKGIMKEAMIAVLSYSFHELDMHRIEAIIDIENSV